MRVLRKRLLAGVTVAVVIILAGTAFASIRAIRAPFTDAVGHEFGREITLLAALRILRGDTGTTNVRPDAPISRAEVAAVIVRMLDREAHANQVATIKPPFKDDTPTWAWGYVNLATSLGIIRGYDDGTFRPGQNVNHAEVLAMLVRATGHDPGVIGAWPFNYVLAGYERGITGRVQIFAYLPATRGEVAHLVYNALFIKRGTGLGDRYDPEGAAAILAARSFTGLVTACNEAAKTIDIFGQARKNMADEVYLSSHASLVALLNTTVRAVANPAGAIVYIEPHEALDVTREVFQRYEITGGVYYLVLADGSRVAYTPGTTRLSVNQGADRALAQGDAGLLPGDRVSITVTAGRAAFVDAFRFNLANKVVEGKTAAGTTPLYLHLDSTDVVGVPEGAAVILNGALARPADLRVDDVVYVATAGAQAGQPAIQVEAIRQTVSGTFVSDRRVYTEATKFEWYFKLRQADGSEREFRWYQPFTGGATPPAIAPGAALIYALDKEGLARRAVAGVTSEVYAKVLPGVSTIPGSTKVRVTLDVRGTTVSYVAATGTVTSWAAAIGKVGRIGVVAATGEIGVWDPLWASSADAPHLGRVHLLDTAANYVMIQLYDSGAAALSQVYLVTHPDFVIYQEAADGTIGDHVRLSNLTVGTRIRLVRHHDGRVLFILRKHNQATW
ncbi:MAG: S-layer homology domain-containing protein [bacterium]|nr:S-layer homology domain-containing protein [bacterium]